MASTYTPLGVELQATGENAGQWGNKTNTNLQIFEQIVGGFTTQAVTDSGTPTALTVNDGSTGATLSHRMIELTGSITGARVVTIPLDAQTFYFLRNSTSGSYTVQFKYASGSGDTFTFSATDKGDAVVFATANDGTNPDIYTLPAGTGDVTLTGTQTLTNKTLTSPKINEDVVVTSTATELNYSDLTTLGTSAASKVLSANANNLTTISGAILNTEDNLTDASSIVWNVINSPVAKVTLTANRAMAAPTGTGIAAGQMISILVIQDAGGTNTLTWNAVYEFPSDTAPTLTSTGSLGDLFSFRYNGAKWLLMGQTLALTLS